MNIFPCPGKPKSSILWFPNSFFYSRLSGILRLVNFTITVLLFLLTRWHASIRSVSMLQPSLSNMPSILSSKVSSFTSLEIPTISRHSVLEYRAFAQHWRSMSTSLLKSRSLTFFDQIGVYQIYHLTYESHPVIQS